MKYYYLMASLPMLDLQGEPMLTYAEFRKLCGEHLTERDLATLDSLVDKNGSDSRHPFVQQWRERETILRNAMAAIRAERTDREAAGYLRETRTCSLHIVNATAEAAAKSTPLERELELDRVRWRFIEELAGFDPFSIDAVLAYGLKLRIAERWTDMDGNKGKEKVEVLVAANRIEDE